MTAVEAGIPSESRQSMASEVRRVVDLLPHPGLVKYIRGYSTQELYHSLVERGDAAFADPIMPITHENVIVEGYAIWELAKLKYRSTLTVYCPPNGLVKRRFSICLALGIVAPKRTRRVRPHSDRLLSFEPWFSENVRNPISASAVGGRVRHNWRKLKGLMSARGGACRRGLYWERLEGEVDSPNRHSSDSGGSPRRRNPNQSRRRLGAKSPEFVQARHLFRLSQP